MASKVLGKLQLTVFPVFKPVCQRKKNNRRNLSIKSHVFDKKTFTKVSENTLKADAYSVLWSIGEQETPYFVFQGTKMCISSNAILTVMGKYSDNGWTT